MPELRGLLRYPFNERQWFIKILVGAVIILVPVLNIMCLGYFLKCTNLGQRGRHFLPEWYDWKDYLRDGGMVLLVTLIYIVIPLVLAALILTIPVVGIVLAVLLFLIMSGLIPMALANYALHQNLQDALMITKVIGQISRVLAIYTIAYVAFLIIGLAAIGLLLAVPLLGLLCGLILFYIGVIFFHLLGCLHREAF